MKKQRAKRLLSLILAMMLVVGMIPMSALAAETLPDYDATANDAIVITASVSKDFGYTYDQVMIVGENENSQKVTISDATGYNEMAPYLTNPFTAGDKRILDVIKDTTKTDVEKAKTIASCVSEAFKGSEQAEVESSTNEKTNYVYVGLKATMNNKTAATYGIKQYAVALEYDSSLLEPANKSGSVVNKALGFSESAPGSFHYDGDYLAGSYDLDVGTPEAAANIAGEGRANLKVVAVTLEPGSNCKFPIPLKTDLEGEGATSWDVVIPFKVLPNAITDTNGTKISIVEGAQNKSTTYGEVLNEDYKTKENIGNTSADQILLTNETKNRLSGNSVDVKIVKRSAAPTVTDPGEYTITDVKNLPYVANGTDTSTLNDTIDIPTGSGFMEGDMVVLFADKDHKVELGRTVLSSDTRVKGDEVTADNPVGATTFRLSQTTVAPGATESDLPTLSTEDAGVCYLKGEKTVYLARVEKANVGNNSIEPSSKEIAVSVDSTDTPIYYHGNVNLLKTGAGSSEENRLQVTFGTPLEDVLTQLNTALSGKVNAPVEDGTVAEKVAGATVSKTVSTSLVTSEATIRESIKDALAVDAKTGKYYIAEHGTLELLFPYQDASDADHVYKQPAAYKDAAEAKDVPVYGAKVYLTVVPNASDYFFVSQNNSNKTLTILGKTKDHFAEGDIIKMYADIDGVRGENPLSNFAYSSFSDGKTGHISNIPDAKQAVWVAYQEKDKAASDAVSTVVTDGTLQIAQDIVFNKSTGEDPTVYQVEAGEANLNLATVLGQILPIDIPLAGSDLMGRAKKEDAALLAESPVEKDGASGTKYELVNTDGTTTPKEKKDYLAAGKDTKWKITMPISAYMLTTLVENTRTSGLADGYKNDKGCSFVLTLSVVDSVKMPAAEGGYVFKTTANNPLVAEDEFTLAGVKDDHNNAVKDDQVLVYDDPDSTDASHQVGVGTVTAVDESTNTFTCKVSQLGRNKGDKVYLYFRHFGLLDMKDPIEVTLDKDEDYTFFGLSSYANPLKLNKAFATKDAVYAEVNNNPPVMKYGYYVKKDGSIQVDDTATFSRTLDSTAYDWTDGYSSGNLDTYFNGTSDNKSTLTLKAETVAAMTSSDQDKTQADVAAKNNVSIVFTAAYPASTETCIKILPAEAKPLDTATVGLIDPQTSVTNNAYPTADQITVKKGTGYDDITVRVYPKQADATAGQNEIMHFDTGAVNSADAIHTFADRATLGTGAGSVWVTYESATSLASTPVEKTYNTEPFIVMSSSINPAASDPINVDVIAPETDPGDGKDALQRLQAKLPTKMYANAEHLEGTDPGYTTIAADSKAVEVTITGWLNDKGDPLTKEDVEAAVATTRANSTTKSSNLSLTAKFDTDPDSVMVGTEKVRVISDTDLGITRAADYNQATYTVTLTWDETLASADPMSLPAAEVIKSHIKTVVGDKASTDETTKYTVNDGDPTNDAIVIDFSDLTDKGDLAGATAVIDYVAPDPTGLSQVEVTLDENGTANVEYSAAAGGFKGFNTSQNTAVNVTFKKANKADSDKYEVTAAGKATSLEIESVENPRTLNLSAGAAVTNKDLVSLLDGVGNATVNFKDGSPASGDLPLVTNAEGKVEWTLMESSTEIENTTKVKAEDLQAVSVDSIKLGSVTLAQGNLTGAVSNKLTLSIGKYYNPQGKEISYTPEKVEWSVLSSSPADSAGISKGSSELTLNIGGQTTEFVVVSVVVDQVRTNVTLKSDSEIPVPTETEPAGWADAVGTADASKHYYMTAEVKTADNYTPEGGAELEVNDTNLLAIVPVMLYNDTSSPLKLADGNSDLYKEGEKQEIEYMDEGVKKTRPSRAYSALQRRANKAIQTGEDFGSSNFADYRTDLVYYFYTDSYDENSPALSTSVVENKSVKVSPYVATLEKVTSLKIDDSTTLSTDDLKAWTSTTAENVKNVHTWESTGADGSKMTAKIEQLNADGTEIAIPEWVKEGSTYKKTGNMLNYIEPRNVADMKMYAGDGQAAVKTYTERYIEHYIVRYTFTVGDEIYAATRKVKLRYVPGDANKDGLCGLADASIVKQASLNLLIPYEVDPAKADQADEVWNIQVLNNDAMEYNGDGLGGLADASTIKAADLNLEYPSQLRW